MVFSDLNVTKNKIKSLKQKYYDQKRNLQYNLPCRGKKYKKIIAEQNKMITII